MRRLFAVIVAAVLSGLLVLGAGKPAFATPILSGTETVVDPSFGAFTVEIDFAVFEDADPDNPAPSPGDLTFVYTLSVLADSAVGLIGFGVAVPPGTDPVTASFVDGTGVEPDAINILANEVRWEFGNVIIDPGQSSEALFVNAPFGPGEVDVSVNGDFALDAPTTLVGPAVPEPALGTLLGVALGLGALRRARR